MQTLRNYNFLNNWDKRHFVKFLSYEDEKLHSLKMLLKVISQNRAKLFKKIDFDNISERKPALNLYQSKVYTIFSKLIKFVPTFS